LVRRSLGGRELVMYAFNGQHPGPLVRVPQGATIVVDLVNRLDQPTAVHWHGVRLENRSDGVPGLTQPPIPPGDTFRYRVRFPDAGIYWYHPHHREDAQQDLGLAGNLLVRPSRPDHYGPANREEVLLLDDLLVGDDGLVPYGRETTTHALMGRVGNLLLVNGEPSYSLRVRRGEVVRFHLTNAANARVFNLSFGGARMKVVGTDVGRFAREAWVESVVLAPAERYVVDVRFDRPGRHPIENRVQAIHRQAGAFFTDVDTLGAVEVSPEPAVPDHGAAFARLRQDPALAAEAARLRARHGGAPARELTLTLRPGDLPFPLVQALRVDTGYVHPVEWSATMPMMDWLSTGRQVEWVLRDRASGRENMAIAWRFRRGELLRLRLVNDRHTLHPMAHPIHVHGQRFLVLAVNGVPNDNPAWKDTVLVPVGATVDLLVELANPGRWMLHCHIAEHLTAGMHLTFEVT
ncbi:MAG TPA: multicopper oxidase family protein, partial [Gemmatimonadales bacterium]|nr:multicopper oxidase family protein [Gemmatimonadales bacterium]